MKISFYLKEPNAKNTTLIFARICYSTIQIKYYTKFSIEPKYWDLKNQLAKKTTAYPIHPEFNSALNNVQNVITGEYMDWLRQNDNTPPTPNEFKNALDIKFKKTPKNAPLTFYTYFDKIIKESKEGKRTNKGVRIGEKTILNYQNTVNKVKDFQQLKRKKEIDFVDITVDFYKEFVQYLTQVLKLKNNTVGKYIKTIKVILNDATEMGVNTNLQFKSKSFVKPTEQVDAIYLTRSEIYQITKLDLTHNKPLEVVRDLFLIGCYTGLRHSDYSKLTHEHLSSGMIEITQTKTGNKITIPIHTEVKKIIEKYKGVLPKGYTNQVTNRYLKTIGEQITLLHEPFTKKYTEAGLTLSHKYKRYELLCSHTARRTFATNEYLEGTPSISIMAITGHRTETEFVKYLKLTPTEHATIVKNIWDKRAETRLTIGV